MNDGKKQIIIVHDEEIELIEHKMDAAISNVFNGNVYATIRLDKVETQTILGLIKEHKLRKQDGDYRAGMAEGYIAAIRDATQKICSMKIKLP